MELTSSDIFVLVVLGLSCLTIIIFCIGECYKEYSHNKVHSLGYEVLDNVILDEPLFGGSPSCYNVVRYKDGCIEYIKVPSEKYFEEKGKVKKQ